MTLKDISSGPDWVIWVVGIILAIFSIILLTGHGILSGGNAGIGAYALSLREHHHLRCDFSDYLRHGFHLPMAYSL